MLDAWFGWLDGKTSKIYTRKADRKRLARAAAERMQNANAPHLEAPAQHLRKTAGGSDA